MTHQRSQDSPDRSAEDLSSSLGVNIARLFNAFDKAIRQEVMSYDLTAIEYNLLWHCLEEEQTATELAQIMPIDGSRISRMVTRLVDRGLLRRRRSRDDRRIVMLSLTEEGFEFTSRILQNMRRLYATFTKGISEEEMLIFESVISKIIANYASMESADAVGATDASPPAQ